MKITNKYNLPLPFVKLVSENYQPTPKRYSGTTLEKPTKQIILSRRHGDDTTMDVSDCMALIRGKAIHYILEQEDGTEFAEMKLQYTLENGYTISGIIDLYDKEKGIVVDYKTCRVTKFLKKDFEDWKKQALIYAWLLFKNGYKVTKSIFYPMMMDWSPGEKKMAKLRGESYPESAFGEVVFEANPNDLTEIELFIRTKIEEIKKAEETSDDEIPPCNMAERWEKPTVYKVYRKDGKKSLKNCATLEEAEIYKEMKEADFIEKCVGEPVRCVNYCPYNNFCNFYREYTTKKV